MITQSHSNHPKIVIDNQDDTYNTFISLLMKSGVFSQSQNSQLRCKKAPTAATIGNKFKKLQVGYWLYEGEYLIEFKQVQFRIVANRGTALCTTQCRQIQYLKQLQIYGPSFQKIKQFVQHIFDLANDEQTKQTITIYQNNGGYWRISKEKKPRKMESVIFKQDFIQSVLADIREFIQSESWYHEMGIPYKRSYLLFGPPGTGKSSFAQAIAGQINYSICFVNCSDKVNDFMFNSLLNQAPKQSIILIQDVDAIFSQRKNTQKMNALTFSGFLNAIDGVRSQQGRIIIMTTNFKDKLDPALLRPGRVDQMYEISYASRYQIEKICYRFYKNQKLAKQFSQKLPQNKFAMSMIQGFLLKYRKYPQKIVQKIQDLLNSDQNVKIDQFLKQINCMQVINDFKVQECYTLAHAKNLPKLELERISNRLNPFLKGRLVETVRMDRKNYIKSDQAIEKFIQQSIKDQQTQRALRKFTKQQNIKTLFLIRDKLKQIQECGKKQQQVKKSE